jgi:cell division control protein 24
MFYQKVYKKIRTCARFASASESVLLKWIDADEDEITIKCDADIEAMFGECKDSGMNHVNLVAR